MKKEVYVCPKCGGEDNECIDYEWDSDTIRQRYMCHNCEAVWDEYHELTYRGYAHNGIDYDENGNVMEFEVAASNEVNPLDFALFVGKRE